MIPDVCLLFIFLALCLTVGTVPVDQDHQGQDEQEVGDQQGVGYTRDNLVPVVKIINFISSNTLVCLVEHIWFKVWFALFRINKQ